MARLAIRKNAKHKKKIMAIEKRYPVLSILDQDATGKLKASLLQENAGGSVAMTRLGKAMGRDPDHAEMMSFLDEIDQKFDLEELDEKNLMEIKEFLRKRGGQVLNNSPISNDGELTREVSLLLSQRLNNL